MTPLERDLLHSATIVFGTSTVKPYFIVSLHEFVRIFVRFVRMCINAFDVKGHQLYVEVDRRGLSI